MTIEKYVENEATVFALSGWLDTKTAPELAAELSGLDAGIKSLIFDLGELEYISSAGLRQLVAAHKMVSGNLVLRNVRPEVLDVLRMAGFDRRLHIEA
jgi:anti-sigma B factor antagonist